MFSNKPAAPKAPWAVRVLTPGFLIDGYTDTDAHPESWPFFTPQAEANSTGMLWLNGPRFTPAGPSAGSPPAVSQWLLPFDSRYVAVMPFDDASLAAMRKEVASFKYPFAAVLHVGPFAITGQLMSNYAEVANLYQLSRHRCLAVQEAAIDYRAPGALFSGLKAPLVMVSTQLLQGIGLAQ